MAVRMRLTRVGSKKNPIYRIVVADSRSPRDGRFIEIVEYLARRLVDDPDAVEVEEVEREGAIIVRLSVAPDDVGKVIGRGGRIARALRTVVRAAATRSDRRVLVEIAE